MKSKKQEAKKRVQKRTLEKKVQKRVGRSRGLLRKTTSLLFPKIVRKSSRLLKKWSVTEQKKNRRERLVKKYGKLTSIELRYMLFRN